MSLRCVIIFSAALKKGALDEAGYARVIESTTRLNTPGPDLARLADVHAMADVTGFGLAGHALEMARGSGCQLRIDWSAVPLLEGARDLAGAGFITGAAGRNWACYGQEVVFSREMGTIDKALLCDPQTSGGLLVACSRSSAPEVLAVFRKHGFEAAVIGEVVTGTAELVVAQRALLTAHAGGTPSGHFELRVFRPFSDRRRFPLHVGSVEPARHDIVVEPLDGTGRF